MDYLALDDRRFHSRGTFQSRSPSDFLLTLSGTNLTPEDHQTEYADDVEADLDSTMSILEQYPLKTTVDAGAPLTTDEIARKPFVFYSIEFLLTFSCKRLVFSPLSSSPTCQPCSRH